MHDPAVVAFDVTLPIPRKYLANPTRSSWPDWGVRRRRRTNPENLGQPVYPWWRPTGYMVFARGRRWRWWGPLFTIWHVEPGGADSGTVCRHWRTVRTPATDLAVARAEAEVYWARFHRDTVASPVATDQQRKTAAERLERAEQQLREARSARQKYSRAWRWHVHHWRITCPPWRGLQRRLFTRCTWCRGRSGRRRDTVNCGRGWDGSSRGKPFWRGEQGLYHSECMAAEDAHKTCMCPVPDLKSYGAWGRCRVCGLTRYHERDITSEAILRMYQALPARTRPPADFLKHVRALRGDRTGVATGA